jgi:uncharacterized protein
MRILVKSLLILCLVVGPAAAQTRDALPATPEIATNGRGEVRVAPDRAVLNVSVETRSPSAASAASDNSARLIKTIASLRSTGVDSAQITTAGYSITQDYDNKNRPSGFIARNGLRVEVMRIADIGRLIDASLAGGATQINQVQFIRSDTKDAHQSALALAVADARRDAETLAQAAGGTLGRLIYLTSGFSTPAFGRDVQLSSVVVTGGLAQTTPIVPGDLIISAIASGRWQFLPGHSP